MATINLLLVTFNCGRELAKPHVFARHLVQSFPGSPAPDLIVLSLQEIAPIAYAFLGGSLLTAYFNCFNRVVDIASRSWTGYENQRYLNLVSRNVGMTALMVFIRSDLADRVRSIEDGGIGVGWYEAGNKGCVGVRLGYEVSSTETMVFTFLSAHLAPMEDRLEKRNQDWETVVKGLVFSPIGGRAETQVADSEQAPLLFTPNEPRPRSGIYTETSYLFLSGDLNYRTSSTKPNSQDISKFPKPADVGHAQHYKTLLSNDQLTTELKAGRTFQGFKEFPINFPPTYKYSDKARAAVQKSEEDQDKVTSEPLGNEFGWASHRWPSWCDRILYLDVPSGMKAKSPSLDVVSNSYRALPLMSTSDHRPVALSICIPARAIAPGRERHESHPRVSPPFAIDTTWRERRTAARRREIVLGLIFYVGLTWEGNTILLATLLGAASGWSIIKSILE